MKRTVYEFLRYAVVGGVAALVDMGVNYAMLYFVLSASPSDTPAVVASVAVGFLAGLAVNFVLANYFVFRTAEQRARGQTAGAFAIYVLVGAVGLGLSTGLTVLGTRFIGEEGIWYILLNCVVKGIVLVWNYVGRKLLVYRGK